jgi:hypothetical protein
MTLDIRQRLPARDNPTAAPLGQEDPPSTRKPCFTLPLDRDPDFVDRPDILAWMNEKHAESTARIALVGLGGFGYVSGCWLNVWAMLTT